LAENPGTPPPPAFGLIYEDAIGQSIPPDQERLFGISIYNAFGFGKRLVSVLKISQNAIGVFSKYAYSL
jgi:hypothetical protein